MGKIRTACTASPLQLRLLHIFVCQIVRPDLWHE